MNDQFIYQHQHEKGARVNELATYQQSGLPAQPEDLAKFIVIAQERAKTIKAEIGAIKRLEVAKEVYEQKMEEQGRLRELLLSAYQRMGEITRELPTRPGARADIEPSPASGSRSDRPKSEVIQELGLSKSQVQRFETMAAHPEIVEEVISESQAGTAEATQGEVLRRIKEREGVIDLNEAREAKTKEEYKRIDHDAKELKAFRDAVDFTGLYIVSPEMLDSVVAMDTHPEETLAGLNHAIQMLTNIKNELLKRRVKLGKKNFHSGG